MAASVIQIDIMDGQFVASQSFSDLERINELNSPAKFEIHLMVKHPLIWIAKLKEVKNITRVIFHIESDDDPKKCLDEIIKNGWKAGIAIKAETPLEKVSPYYDIVDEILFMTVNPGQQGGEFLPSVREKILNFTALQNRPLCAVDGGLNETNILEVKDWGVEIFGIGSAIAKTANPAKEYYKFMSLIER